MESPQSNGTEGIDFVHFAIPNLALSEIDTAYVLGGASARIELRFPLVVFVKDHDEAKELSIDYKSIPIAVERDDSIEIFVSGIGRSVRMNKQDLVRVGNGIDVAKALRLRPQALPFIEKDRIEDIDALIKQLRIVMFLTNSKNIEELINAPIYNE
jgi:hypothetical protein